MRGEGVKGKGVRERGRVWGQATDFLKDVPLLSSSLFFFLFFLLLSSSTWRLRRGSSTTLQSMTLLWGGLLQKSAAWAQALPLSLTPLPLTPSPPSPPSRFSKRSC